MVIIRKTYFLSILLIHFTHIQSANNISQKDKIDLIVPRGFNNIIKSDFETASKNIDSIFYFSKQIKYYGGNAQGLYLRGMYHQNMANHKKAEQFYNRALIYYDRAKLKAGPVKNQLLKIYRQTGRYSEALKLCDEVIAIRKTETDILPKEQVDYGIHNLMCLKGRIYQEKGDIKKALETFQYALAFAEKINNKDSKIKTHLYLSALYQTSKNCELAEQYAIKSFEDTTEANPIVVNPIFKRLGELYFECYQDYNKAEFFFKKYARKSDLQNKLQNILSSKLFLAKTKIKLNKIDTANQLIKSVISEINTNENLELKFDALVLYGDLFAMQKQWDEAIKYYELALPTGEHLSNINKRLEIYSKLGYVAEKKQNYRLALSYFKKSQSLNDSIFSKQKLKDIRELESKYQTETKQQEITLLKKNDKLKESQLKTEQKSKIYLVLLILVILIASGIIYQRIKLKQRIIITEKERNVSEIKQKLLLSQLNPHFVFSALSSIDAYILKNKVIEASQYLTDFAKLIRLILETSRAEQINIENEIKILEFYLKLEQLRLKHMFNYKINIDSNIPKNTYIPSMMLQPFVENAINHGIQNEEKKGLITIDFKLNKVDDLQVEIIDNGVGIKNSINHAHEKTNHQSLSLKIIEERLEMMELRYSKKINLDIINLEDQNKKGTKIILTIPKELTTLQTNKK